MTTKDLRLFDLGAGNLEDGTARFSLDESGDLTITVEESDESENSYESASVVLSVGEVVRLRAFLA